LKNTGKVDGAEAVQVYASQPKASVLRPAKELKAFKKVFLKAGETQTVQLEM
jgi:beta-glucosidase